MLIYASLPLLCPGFDAELRLSTDPNSRAFFAVDIAGVQVTLVGGGLFCFGTCV